MGDTSVTSRSLNSFFAALFTSALVLNWFWEMLQAPAYATMSNFLWAESVRICTIAALADAMITLGIYGIGALVTMRIRWAMAGGWKYYLLFAFLGAAAAATIEWLALASERWIYHDRMPTVPLLGIGLWPFLQLTLLVPAALWIGVWWSGRRSTTLAAHSEQ
ncbi:MAG: hypothetical protein ACT4P8_05555 [Betaproteobacteria bacterium]